jgi:hypothetical protein
MYISEIWVVINHVPECTWLQGPVWGAVPVVRHTYNEENWMCHNPWVSPVSSNECWSIHVREEAQNLGELCQHLDRWGNEILPYSAFQKHSLVHTLSTHESYTHIIAAMHRQRMLFLSFVLHSASVVRVAVTTFCTDLMPLVL